MKALAILEAIGSLPKRDERHDDPDQHDNAEKNQQDNADSSHDGSPSCDLAQRRPMVELASISNGGDPPVGSAECLRERKAITAGMNDGWGGDLHTTTEAKQQPNSSAGPRILSPKPSLTIAPRHKSGK